MSDLLNVEVAYALPERQTVLCIRVAPGTSVPQHNPLNPRYRLMIETWRRLPRWVVDRAGPLLVRGLG